jgi:alcohol dehydrogenase (cytochrome c)
MLKYSCGINISGARPDRRSRKGRMRKLVVQANRNAFYYVLDRVTGQSLTVTPNVKQNWAHGLDARGRPIRISKTEPSPDGRFIYPGHRPGH